MKRYLSLSTAIMLGTVLSKEHGQMAKSLMKTKQNKKEEKAVLPKIQSSFDSLEEYRVKIENMEGFKHLDVREDSPKTSVESESFGS